MKLRFAANSLRLRLRKSDIELLKKQGFVKVWIPFGESQPLAYELRLDDSAGITARFENNEILVQLPRQEAAIWMDSDQVSLAHNTDTLHLLIEKDFPCKHTSTEDKEDTFYELAP